jgi:glycosyltransferase involved in cell wall biosynthesis
MELQTQKRDKINSDTKYEVLVAGNPRWAKVLSDELSAMGIAGSLHPGLRNSLQNLKLGSIKKFFTSKILHWVSGLTRPPHLFKFAKQQNKKIVVHWIGTDVVQLKDYVVLNKRLPLFLSEIVDVHLADSPAIQEELTELGISTKVIRLLPQTVEAEVQPLPIKPAVLAYWSDESRAEFYGGSFILSLARHLPDIPFYVVGSGRGNMANVPANVSFLGEVTDMESVYKKISVFVRFIQHDSLSAMVLEALARGKYVFYSHQFPHTTRLKGLDDGIKALKGVCSETNPNWVGSRYVCENFSWRAEINELKNIYVQLLG